MFAKKTLRLIFALRHCLQKNASLNFCTPALFAKKTLRLIFALLLGR